MPEEQQRKILFCQKKETYKKKTKTKNEEIIQCINKKRTKPMYCNYNTQKHTCYAIGGTTDSFPSIHHHYLLYVISEAIRGKLKFHVKYI